MIYIAIHNESSLMIIFLLTVTLVNVAQSVSALPGNSERMSMGLNPMPGNFFSESINQFTIMKFQLIAVEYIGSQFTKIVFNPKPEALGEGLFNLYFHNLHIL